MRSREGFGPSTCRAACRCPPATTFRPCRWPGLESEQLFGQRDSPISVTCSASSWRWSRAANEPLFL